ncbi:MULTISPECIES: penicillin-binding protein 1A [Maribacter]|uniref:Penicillin-binding protein 1A n=2 Tax=Maribacter dokdonensis TaxID=320912 RepID=A0A1H4LB51_9FLAO|nr:MULTISPECIES: transglycosylase domain-containing protein [Maribacter]HAF78772.1 penicillin-binding protein [Maribacter sp.]KSA12742.1 Penicillin-binding protein 1A, family GT51 [Maribacter dokdonensis DSW-8]MBU2900492.1 penicillin-binding protein [Maribacter dokdonensis]PHN94882.1 penicillin-binding protein [Maribacter sp. 6B07]CAG2533471.1 penicillin-binding protein 1A [Maribacter dokdonensis]|tara:strand:- start:46575 stop:48920 length:2346 start_codon:yes stop_codon:yes gene_type:complete
MAKAVKKKTTNNFSKFILWFWILFASGIALVALIFLSASWGLFGELPPYEYLENPQTNLASQIISSDGKLLGKFYLDDNRTDVKFEELPDNLVNALIATEDARFRDHSGIDARGTVRAFAYLGSKGGASTISQQLARQLFVGVRSRSKFDAIKQKIKEWVLAIRLERSYTKEEIISMYFNIYDFGNNADGIRSAARIYFGKEPKDLKIEESAMLVGMFKNSSLFNPLRREEMVKTRRDVVLAQMAKYDYITEVEKDSLQAMKMDINYNPETHSVGLATYFRMYLQRFMKDWIDKNPKPAIGDEPDKYNLYLDGLKIYTTIDSKMQANAEEAVNEHMTKLQAEFFHQNTPDRNKTAPFLDITPEETKAIMERAMKNSDRWKIMKSEGKSEKEIRESFDKKTEMTVFDWKSPTKEKDTILTPRDSIRYYKAFLRTAMMSMEPQTGHVKAWVGGINYKHFQYDNVIQGARQAGSTFKPFVYAAAIDQLRLSPCETRPDTQYCIEAGKHGNMEPWCPRNSNLKYSGNSYSLKKALANSVNTVTAQLIDEVGPKSVVSMVRNLGLTGDILEVPSIALGTLDVNVYEMVGAYGAFANQGVYVKPVMVTRIENKDGTVLYEYVPETKDVLSKDVSYAILDLMKGVTQGGSGTRLRTTGFNKWRPEYDEIITGYPYKLTNPIAGKTGTTQNNSDGWFMGMVPNLVTGVWVGGEERSVHFKSITYGQGASMALPIWGLYMTKNYADEELGISKEDFVKPENMSIEIDCDKFVEGTNTDSDTDDDLDDLDF